MTTRKLHHTPGPWHKASQEYFGDCAAGSGIINFEEKAIVNVACPQCLGDRDRVEEDNAHLLCLAPLAPHDCDVPGCPGPANLRKQELYVVLLEALKEIAKRTGAYSRDRLKHCENTVDHMAEVAEAAIAKAEGQQ